MRKTLQIYLNGNRDDSILNRCLVTDEITEKFRILKAKGSGKKVKDTIEIPCWVWLALKFFFYFLKVFLTSL